MILEGIVTTTGPDGATHVTPMGPRVEASLARFELRPFQTATTFQNLVRHGWGVLHVTDDVELLAAAALGVLAPPACVPVAGWPVARLVDCCRWCAFQVESIDAREARARIVCRTVASGRVRDFFGFNRAKHAVVEGAILATRIGILPAEEIRAALARLAPLVEKTAGDAETRAWRMLLEQIEERLPALKAAEEAQ